MCLCSICIVFAEVKSFNVTLIIVKNRLDNLLCLVIEMWISFHPGCIMFACMYNITQLCSKSMMSMLFMMLMQGKHKCLIASVTQQPGVGGGEIRIGSKQIIWVFYKDLDYVVWVFYCSHQSLVMLLTQDQPTQWEACSSCSTLVCNYFN